MYTVSSNKANSNFSKFTKHQNSVVRAELLIFNGKAQVASDCNSNFH